MKKVLSVLALICVAFILSGCSDSESEKFTHTIDKIRTPDGDYFIDGTVTNVSNEDYLMRSIQFICYDAKGRILGTAIKDWDGEAKITVPNQTIKYTARFKGDPLDETYDSLETTEFFGEEKYIFSPAHYIDHCNFDKITYRLNK